MDITATLAPKSDQLDAIDLVGGPRIFTVTDVTAGNAEQPVNVHLAEFDRVWRPGKSMRRVLAAGWGTDASNWKGRKIELFCDLDVQFGGERVGGTRISRMSHLDKPLQVPLLIKRGKSAIFKVQPLPADTPATDPLVAAKASLWAVWTEAGGGDAASLAAAFEEATGGELGNANAEELAAFTATLTA